MAALRTFSGVSKSGSPAASEMTSFPARFISAALELTATVADGWMRPSGSDRNAIALLPRDAVVSRASRPNPQQKPATPCGAAGMSAETHRTLEDAAPFDIGAVLADRLAAGLQALLARIADKAEIGVEGVARV